MSLGDIIQETEKHLRLNIVRIFLTKVFSRFVRSENIIISTLIDAITRAEKGQIDADLGGGVIKQRIARPGEGKSGGYRTIILYRLGDKAFFVYGFSKSVHENITDLEKRAFKKLASEMLNYEYQELEKLKEKGIIIEVGDDEKNI
ncbi:type II toxin-antitoxin system RelE/ParE family toxin [bacterium]|nr:type II toxin-antitoxin system RelE/ParE family toxin [bacterium]